MSAPSPHPRRQQDRAVARRIWWLSAVIALAAGGLGIVAGLTWSGPLLDGLPWWVLVLAFAACEVAAVHLHFSGQTHTFTFTETALAVGLLTASPGSLLAAHLLGGGVARAVWRRQAVIKQAFNTATAALDTMLGVVLFQALRGSNTSLGPRLWLAMLVALLVTSAVSSALVAVVISLTQRQLGLGPLRQTLAPALIVTATNTCLGLAVATLLDADRRSIVLLVIPAVTVWGAYLAYTAQRQAHEGLEFLYRCSRQLHEAADRGRTILALLADVRATLSSVAAELILANGRTYRSHAVEGDRQADQGPSPAVARLLEAMDGRDRPMIIERDRQHPEHVAMLDERGVDDAMVAAIEVHGGVKGVLVVSGSLPAVARFSRRQARLLGALATQTSTELEAARLEQAVSELQSAQQELTHQMLHDPLTGLANRTLFEQQLDALATGRDGEDGLVALLFVDLDDFKGVNDTFGHRQGDVFLQQVADRLRSAVRPSDTVARLGGDEFALLLRGLSTPADADWVVERVLRLLRTPIAVEHTAVHVRASVGVATAAVGPAARANPPPGDAATTPGEAETTPDEADTTPGHDLLRKADAAMYAAKAKGKGGVAWFDGPVDVAEFHGGRIHRDLQQAIEDHEIEVVFQPILDLTTRRWIAVEALARWHRPGGEVIPVEEFIALAEETGLAVDLGREVRRRALHEAAAWRDAVGGTLRLYVNISGSELRDPDFVSTLVGLAHDAGWAPGRITLEITERVLVHNDPRTLGTLTDARALGMRVAIDDFGVGYSSLGYLRWLPVDALKIDRSFLTGLEANESAQALLASVVAVGLALDLEVMVEGIETEGQAELVTAFGAAAGQGFYLGRPLPARRLEPSL